MAVAVGFALVGMAVPTVGKRVCLFAVSTIPTVMHGMTTAAATVKKAALGRKKNPPLAVKKTAAYWKHLPSRLESPSPAILQGLELILAVF